ncbi:MAG TPA: ATP-binding protein [Verrucomicrobiae bacterium]|nr:ATP-binding protein [Verrucomicrobiae bacterium]
MIAHRSISLRLTVWFSSVVFAGLVIFGAVMWLDLKGTLTSGRSRTLERRAERLEDLLRATQSDPITQRDRKFRAFAEATGGGLIEVFRADGSRAFPSPTVAAQAFPWQIAGPLDRDSFTEVKFQGQAYRVLEHPFSATPAAADRFILFAAAPLEGNRNVLRAFTDGLLWAIPVLLVVSAIGGYTLSRKALKPVDQITAATRSISVSNLSGRLPVPHTRDELQRLSETCNEMLARLESAVNEIKRFTDDASHELRNPVSFVRTTAELALRNAEADPASRRAFEEIVTECGKANRLLKDMLTLARADAGNAQLAFEPVDLAEVVKAACQKTRVLAEERRHTLATHIEDAYATVWGDYSTLSRLLLILLDNAVKYTPPPGTIRVTVASAGGKATVTVEDTGIGISAADLPRIFGRFYRADPSRSQVEGSGLGLSIAMLIANVHQASLSAASKENAGSVFRIVFPLLPSGPGRKETASRSLTSVG